MTKQSPWPLLSPGTRFVASELYQPVAMLTSYGFELDANVADDRRAAVTLLRKRL